MCGSITQLSAITAILMMLICFEVSGITVCDDFEIDHDYITQGTGGTIWDGITGKDNLTIMSTDFNEGKLYIESGNSGGPGSEPGVLIYKEVLGNWRDAVTITDASGLYGGPPAADNSCGLMARVSDIDSAGPGEDSLALIYSNGYLRIVSVGDGIYSILSSVIWPPAGEVGFTPFIWMEQASDRFYFRYSADGIFWHNMPGSPVQRQDMAGLLLQAGLMQASSAVGFGEFDDFCLERDAIYKAYSPIPFDGGRLDLMRPILSWSPSDFASCENYVIYFGADFNDVNDATVGDPEYRGPCICSNSSGRCCYNASVETLVIGNQYYWRVDEVNGPSVWKGDVWRFTVQDYTTIEDFEKYVSTGFPVASDTLRKTWIDGLWGVRWTPPVVDGTSGSFVQLNTDKHDGYPTPVGSDVNIALLGRQSMKFYYDNDGVVAWMIDLYKYGSSYSYLAPKYSEAAAAIDDAARLDTSKHSSLGLKRNWSGFKMLKISFYGDPNNTVAASDKLYVGLWDGDNNPAAPVVIEHPDNTMLQEAGWHDWCVPLSEFTNKNANLNLDNIARIYIGVGNRTTPLSGGRGAVFFDEIQLLACGCRGDLNSDCEINNEDLKIFAEEWLTEGIYADIIDNDKVDFRDFAFLANSWLNNCQ